MKDFKGKGSGPQALEQIAKDGSLAGLMQAAARLDRMTSDLQSVLPQHLREHVRVAGFERGLLTLLLDDRAYMVESRFLSQSLVAQLSARLPGLKNIQWKITRPRKVNAQPPRQLPAQPPKDIDEWLIEAAQRGTQNPSDG